MSTTNSRRRRRLQRAALILGVIAVGGIGWFVCLWVGLSIVWEGWDISKARDDNELSLKRGLDGGVKVSFRKQMSDETTFEREIPQDELELEYELKDKNGALQYKAKEKEEFLGLIKKYKF